jgi:hypothetical protein
MWNQCHMYASCCHLTKTKSKLDRNGMSFIKASLVILNFTVTLCISKTCITFHNYVCKFLADKGDKPPLISAECSTTICNISHFFKWHWWWHSLLLDEWAHCKGQTAKFECCQLVTVIHPLPKPSCSSLQHKLVILVIIKASHTCDTLINPVCVKFG